MITPFDCQEEVVENETVTSLPTYEETVDDETVNKTTLHVSPQTDTYLFEGTVEAT